MRLRPAFRYGRTQPTVTTGSHHIRYVGPDLTLRLTTDASLTAILEERPFFVEDDGDACCWAPTNRFPNSLPELGRHFVEATLAHWREWVRGLAIPFEWQSAVIRAAITLKLNAFDDTGAIIAAMTTSIPEAPGFGPQLGLSLLLAARRLLRRQCAEPAGRDHARWSATCTTWTTIAAAASDGPIQPVYRISGSAELDERIEDALPGYRGMGPVRVGNDAWRQVQHDVYGSAILAATHVFFDERLTHRGDVALFERLEPLGRTRRGDARPARRRPVGTARQHARAHIFQRDVLGGVRSPGADRRSVWRCAERAQRLARRCRPHSRSSSRRTAGTPSSATFVSTTGGRELDASLLLLAELNFCAADDPRYVATVDGDRARPEARRIRLPLRRDRRLRRAVERVPRLHVLAGRCAGGDRPPRRGARAVHAPARVPQPARPAGRARASGAPAKLWGNFVQTYSMVGLINVGDPPVGAVGRCVLIPIAEIAHSE